MRILVTGASGFVGRWLVSELRKARHDVYAMGGRADTPLEDRDEVLAAVAAARPDAIAHLAAIADPIEAARDPEQALAVNVGGTVNLMEACLRLPERPVVLVASSSAVYGRPRQKDLPLTEDAPLAPQGVYALTKAAQEAVALSYAGTRGACAVVTRAFNHSGPFQGGTYVLPSFVARVREAKAKNRRWIAVGDIDVARDILDVRDVVTAYRGLMENVAQHRGSGSLVVNIASGKSVRLRDLLDRLCSRAGVRLAYRPAPELLRPGEPREIRGDASRLRSLTAWAPQHDIMRTIEEMWDGAAPGG